MRSLLLIAALAAPLAPATAETIYVSNERANTISVIDAATLKVTATSAALCASGLASEKR